jgi:hypothetical protein
MSLDMLERFALVTMPVTLNEHAAGSRAARAAHCDRIELDPEDQFEHELVGGFVVAAFAAGDDCAEVLGANRL